MGLRDRINSHIKNYFEIVQNARFTNQVTAMSIDEWFVKVIGALNNIKVNKNRLFFIGNGASASISAHFAVDFTMTF